MILKQQILNFKEQNINLEKCLELKIGEKVKESQKQFDDLKAANYAEISQLLKELSKLDSQIALTEKKAQKLADRENIDKSSISE